MFKLNIDAILYFDPPMVAEGKGITMTREFQIPFPPAEDIALTGVALNGRVMSLGFALEGITWDIDREVFFAKTTSSYFGEPIASIPLELRSWIERGWKLGSYEDTYEKQDRRASRFHRKPIRCTWNWEDDEVAAEWEGTKPSKRPAAFNKLFDAIIREMAVLDNNCAVAYAMRHTHVYLGTHEIDKAETAIAKKFRDAMSQYVSKGFDWQYDWRHNLARKCPHLDQFVMNSPRRTER